MSSPELVACPCGLDFVMDEGPCGEWIVCCDCGATTPMCGSKEEAALAWNRIALAEELESLTRRAHAFICAGTLGYIFGERTTPDAESTVNSWIDDAKTVLSKLGDAPEGVGRD